jgi:hypothetical protein
MKKTSKILASIVILFVIAGLTLPLLKIYAAESAPSQDNSQASQDSQASLEQVQGTVDELVQLKDDSSISAQEKEKQEIQIRKKALDQILDLSLSDIKNLEDKLNALTLTTDDQKAARGLFLAILDKNINYSESLKVDVDKDGITLDEIKNLAQEYKDWRANNYDTYVKKMTAFILIYQEQGVLKIANIRLDKIISDLNNLEKTNLINKEDTWDLLNLSMNSLGNAKIYNDSAAKIVAGYVQDLLAAASSTQEQITATTSPESLVETLATSSQLKIEMASTTATSTATSAKQINIDDKSHSLIEQSLQEIKNAYNDFIKISNIVSQKLNLK